MSNEEILTKAIEKALANGWNMFRFAGLVKSWNVNEQEFAYQSWLYGRIDDRLVYPLKVSLNDVIFSHDFAKAFFKVDCRCECHKRHGILREEHSPVESCCKCADWEWHLQQMVLEEDPIKYLEKYLT
jgi:hypothetical protein